MLAEEGLTRLGMGREAFEKRVWEWKRQYGDFITGQMRRLGASCDWSRERFTLDSQLSGLLPEVVRSTSWHEVFSPPLFKEACCLGAMSTTMWGRPLSVEGKVS